MTPTVVFLNGWGMTSRVWEALLAPLEHAFDPVFVDLGAMKSHATLESAAAAVAQSAPASCDVVGWSLGAQIALQWAHDEPSQVKRLALIAATPAFVQRADWADAMPAAVFDEFAAQVESDCAQALSRFTLLQARGDAEGTRVARALRASTAVPGADGPSAFAAGLALLRSGDLRPLLARVRQPVYLAHGENDALVPRAAAQRLQRDLPRARLDLLPAVGHAPHVSRPGHLGAALRSFFQ